MMGSYWTRTGAAILVLPLLAGAGLAADCPQDHAVYRDATNQYEISFAPVPAAAAVSHQFSLTVLKGGLKIDGNVQLTDDVPRSLGTLLFQCPDGDVTGADLEACTIWQGLIYSVDASARIGNLGDASAPAASQILLADLGAALRISKLWSDKKISAIPFDSFSFRECRP